MASQTGASRRAILALPACLALLTGGCGLLFSEGPPVGHERMDFFVCTESDAGPALDFAWAGLNVLGALVVAQDPAAYEDPGATIAIGLGWGVLSSTAGVVGLNRSRKCRAAKLLLAQRQPLGAPARPSEPVDAAVQSVVVTAPEDTVAVGESMQLVAAAYHSSGVRVPSALFRWSSSNDAIAAVSRAGLVTAHAPGTVVIAANSSNIVGIATIVVILRRQ